MELTIKLGKIKLDNPIVLASGILGVSGSSLVNVSKKGAGAVTTKSIGLKERKGHPAPCILTYEAGMINAVGLSTPDLKQSIEELAYAVKKSPSPVIASIAAHTIKDFGKLAKEVSKAKPALIEANISCPNVDDEFGKPFAFNPKQSAAVTRIIKKNTKIPVFVKLSPNTPDIVEVAKAVEKAGADGITAINTVGPGMIINIETAKPILSNKAGGLSGPAIKPVAVRCVYEIYKAVKIPIIGTGGITNGRDAIEIIMAGASAVGVGSAVYYRGIDVFSKISEEISDFMQQNSYTKLSELRGIAHEN